MDGSGPRRTRRGSFRRMAVALVAVAAVPVVLLGYVALGVGATQLRAEADTRVRTMSVVGAAVVAEHLRSAMRLVQTYAQRPDMIAALGRGPAGDRAAAAGLAQLAAADPDIGTAFIATPDGGPHLAVPPAPDLVATALADRGWVAGLQRTGAGYVSPGFQPGPPGSPPAVAVLSSVRDPGTGTTLGIVGAAYPLSVIRRVAEGVSRGGGVELMVADQRGTALLDGGDTPGTLGPRVQGAGIDAALAGRSGVTRETASDGTEVIAGYAPIAESGWMVQSETPAVAALAAIRRIQGLVGMSAGVMGVLVILALVHFARIEARRRRMTDRMHTSSGELAAANADLRQLDQMKGELIATVSHELRTPLASIRGYTELLADGDVGELTGPQQRVVETIDRNGGRLLALIDDLLTFGHLDTGQFTLHAAPVELAAIVREVVASIESTLPPHLALATRIDDQARVLGDAGELRRVLTHLLGNAVKFSPDGGTIDVTVAVAGAEVTVEIRDPGLGIPAGEQELVFERFYRADAARQREIQGPGLGLPLCRRIVDHHGGRLTLQSIPEAGSTVTLVLPVLVDPPAGPAGADPTAAIQSVGNLGTSAGGGSAA